MKIGYLIYNERPNSGLMNSQVLGLLKKLSENNALNITLIAIWQPWVYFKYFNEIKILRVNLNKHNIKLKSIPFGFPSRYFFTNQLLLNMNITYIYLVLKIFNLNKYDIIHCRGYFISYVSALLKNKNKLIFDMRSLFPEENISASNWTKNDLIYNKWKDIEKYTINKSEAVIGVSIPMVDILSKEYKIQTMKYIPIGFREENFIFNKNKRDELRKKLKIEDKIVIVYAGSLELGFWNDIRVYVKYFSWINNNISDVHFMILTGSNHEIIHSKLKANNINNYTLKSVSSKEIAHYLSASDIGIQVMNKMSDSQTRFGVKTIEYWATGLPLITNSNVGGITKIVKNNYYLGIIIDSEESIDDIKEFIETNQDRNIQIIKYARDNFIFKHIAKQYIELYK